MKARLINLLALGVGLTAATGCQHVQPWQRSTLADPAMLANRDPLGTAQKDHIYFSREAAAGGAGVGGGGCGCN